MKHALAMWVLCAFGIGMTLGGAAAAWLGIWNRDSRQLAVGMAIALTGGLIGIAAAQALGRGPR